MIHIEICVSNGFGFNSDSERSEFILRHSYNRIERMHFSQMYNENCMLYVVCSLCRSTFWISIHDGQTLWEYFNASMVFCIFHFIRCILFSFGVHSTYFIFFYLICSCNDSMYLCWGLFLFIAYCEKTTANTFCLQHTDMLCDACIPLIESFMWISSLSLLDFTNKKLSKWRELLSENIFFRSWM